MTKFLTFTLYKSCGGGGRDVWTTFYLFQQSIFFNSADNLNGSIKIDD